MIVEFVGFPGSGKTSIVHRIVRSSAAIDFSVSLICSWPPTRAIGLSISESPGRQNPAS